MKDYLRIYDKNHDKFRTRDLLKVDNQLRQITIPTILDIIDFLKVQLHTQHEANSHHYPSQQKRNDGLPLPHLLLPKLIDIPIIPLQGPRQH